MSTTALFAELLVCGLQTLAWLGLVATAILGPRLLDPLLKAPALASVFLIALAYALGVVFDRFWDRLLDGSGVDGWLRRKARVAASAPRPKGEFDAIRRRVYGADPATAARFVDYNRSRMRIARSTTFNLLLITVAGMACLFTQAPSWTYGSVLLVGLGGMALSVVSGFAYYDLRMSYYRVLQMVLPSVDAAKAGGEQAANPIGEDGD